MLQNNIILNTYSDTQSDILTNTNKYNIELEEKLYYNKMISRAKTMYSSKPITSHIFNKKPLKYLIDFTFFEFELYNTDEVNLFEQFNSIISDSKIIISTSTNPFLKNEYILEFPGFLCLEDYTINSNKIKYKIMWDNFIPNGLEGKGIYYFYIIFPLVIKSQLIKSSSVEINFKQLNQVEQTNLTKLNLKYLGFNSNFINISTGLYQFIQSTQTEKFSTEKLNYKNLKCNIEFHNMCRGFWIKIHSTDYNKLVGLKFLSNGNQSFEVDKSQLIMIVDIKLLYGYQIIFINLQLDQNDWNLSANFDECNKIYSSSFNLSRIDSFVIEFNFNADYLSKNPITISSIFSNILGMELSNLNKKFSVY